MTVKPFPPTLLRDCECSRVGYLLVLCAEHAPIPFELTDRGRRATGTMKQWDAMFETLEQDRPASAKRAALDPRNWGRAAGK